MIVLPDTRFDPEKTWPSKIMNFVWLPVMLVDDPDAGKATRRPASSDSKVMESCGKPEDSRVKRKVSSRVSGPTEPLPETIVSTA